MVGFSVQTDAYGAQEGLIIYVENTKVFLTKEEASMLSQLIQRARLRYWKRFKLPHMVPTSGLDLGNCTQIKP